MTLEKPADCSCGCTCSCGCAPRKPEDKSLKGDEKEGKDSKSVKKM